MKRWWVLASFLAATPSVAQTVTPSFENVTRVESWSFFEPPPEGGEPRYTFPATRVRFGVDVEARRVTVKGAFNYVRTENLPHHAIGPLALGSGGFYYGASGASYSYQLYLSELTLTSRFAERAVALQFGRMRYQSGAEAFSSTEHIDAIKRLRLNGRLIGAFDWSMYQRRFDGVRLDITRPRWAATGAVLLPTQGGYEESANLTMAKVQVGGGAATIRTGDKGSGELQAFVYAYRDRRSIQVRPDNTGLFVRAADVTLTAVGGSHVGVYSTRGGALDTLVWGAGQLGDWYGQRHRAYAAAAELGHRWAARPLAPWLRTGVLVASGDDDYADDRHHTFFPMLPNSRTYALSAVYTQMNLHDLFAQVLLERGAWRGRVDWHHLTLDHAGDRWYHGSGATSRDGLFFGFSGRPSGGGTSLGTILEGALDIRLMKYWSINGYLGRMRGGDVVRASFTGDRLLFWYVENVVGF